MRALRILALILVVLAIGALAFRYGGTFKLSGPWHAQDQGPNQDPGLGGVGPVVPLEPFLVTQWQNDRQEWTSVTFELEVDDDQGRDAVKARTSEIRSQILALLADTQLSAVGEASDYEALKLKVQNRIQPLLVGHRIRRVLITEFLSQ